MRLAKHFTVEEFERSQYATRHDIPNILPPDLYQRAEALCQQVLEPLRERYERPVIITSGYRCKTLNYAIGGSANSQHTMGEAADILVPGAAPYDVCLWLQDSGLPFDQLIYEGRWTHVSLSGQRNRHEVLTALFHREGGVKYLQGLVAMEEW